MMALRALANGTSRDTIYSLENSDPLADIYLFMSQTGVPCPHSLISAEQPIVRSPAAPAMLLQCGRTHGIDIIIIRCRSVLGSCQVHSLCPKSLAWSCFTAGTPLHTMLESSCPYHIDPIRIHRQRPGIATAMYVPHSWCFHGPIHGLQISRNSYGNEISG